MTAGSPDPGPSRTPWRQGTRQFILFGQFVLCTRILWIRLWPVFATVLASIGIGLSGLLPALPVLWHALILLGLFSGFCIACVRAFDNLSWPTMDQTISWLETRNAASDHPLATLQDQLSTHRDNEVTRNIWEEHVRRAQKRTRHLQFHWPNFSLAAADPYALRTIAVIVFITGLAIGHENPADRLLQAFIPRDIQSSTAKIDVWVHPPSYTGHPPFHLSSDTITKDIEPPSTSVIPVGSDVLVQVAGPREPELIIGSRPVRFETLGEQGYKAETKIGASDATVESTKLSVRIPGTLSLNWSVQLVDDAPPVIDFTEEPQPASRGRLEISFGARDDYGLRDINLVVLNTAVAEDSSEQNLFRIGLPLPNANEPTIAASVIKDLSEHNWAGLPVAVSLEATDAIGQIGRSGVLTMVLPERPFNHPVAKQLIQYRKQLFRASAESIDTVITGLDDLSAFPGRINHDTVAFLAMRIARFRLLFNVENPDTETVRDILWNTALRIEDGEFAVAGRALTDAHDQLLDAMREGVTGEAFDNLLNSLREALDRFMAALAEQLNQKGLDSVTDLPGMAFMDNTDIMNMLDDARELARTGSLEAARQTLEQLRNMLESIQVAMNSDIPLEQFNAQRQMLEDLFTLTQRQESLLDQTFRMNRQNAAPRERSVNSNSVDGTPEENQYAPFVDIQENLRRELMKLMPKLRGDGQKIPSTAIDAERSMQKSIESLQKGDGGKSVVHQSDALDALRKTGDDIAEKMAQQMQSAPGSMSMPGGILPGSGSDPFGRTGTGGLSSQMDDGSVQIPTEFEMQRVQEIFDELQRRSNDRTRSEQELQYIKRLLRPF